MNLKFKILIVTPTVVPTGARSVAGSVVTSNPDVKIDEAKCINFIKATFEPVYQFLPDPEVFRPSFRNCRDSSSDVRKLSMCQPLGSVVMIRRQSRFMLRFYVWRCWYFAS
jgi:hypothetical protein